MPFEQERAEKMLKLTILQLKFLTKHKISFYFHIKSPILLPIFRQNISPDSDLFSAIPFHLPTRGRDRKNAPQILICIPDKILICIRTFEAAGGK